MTTAAEEKAAASVSLPRRMNGPPSHYNERGRWSPTLAKSPKHAKGAPSPRSSAKRAPRVLEFSLEVIALAAGMLFPAPGSDLARAHPKTRVLNVLDALQIPSHLRGTLATIAQPANSKTCRCIWRSYPELAPRLDLTPRQVIDNVADLESYGCVATKVRSFPRLGNVACEFTVQVPPLLRELAAKHAAAAGLEPSREPAPEHPSDEGDEAAESAAPPEMAVDEIDEPADVGAPREIAVEDAQPAEAQPVGEPAAALVLRAPAPVLEGELLERPEGSDVFEAAVASVRALSPVLFDRWFGGVQFDGLTDGFLLLHAQNDFVKDWVQGEYLPTLTAKIRELSGAPVEVRWLEGVEGEAFEPIAKTAQAVPARPRPAPVPAFAAAQPPKPDPHASAHGAILELLRAREHVYRHLPEAVELFAKRLADDMVRDEEMPLVQVLIGLWECSTKPGPVGAELSSFAVGCVRGVRALNSPPKPVKAILSRARQGLTVASLSLGARAPPKG
jgi:hypothetical protein